MDQSTLLTIRLVENPPHHDETTDASLGSGGLEVTESDLDRFADTIRESLHSIFEVRLLLIQLKERQKLDGIHGMDDLWQYWEHNYAVRLRRVAEFRSFSSWTQCPIDLQRNPRQ